MHSRILALVVAAGMLAACGGKDPGPGPTPVIDPPAVVCPADVSITGITGSSEAVTFATPIPTAGTQPVTVTCTPNSGSAFPLGTTAVRCTASDAAARQASCTFNVTVKGLKIAVTKYLTFGDSVTEGQNGQSIGALQFVDLPNAYPTKLQSLLEATYPGQGITVLNGGWGGEPIEKAVARLPEVMAAERPGAVLLIDGYNNLLGDCSFADGVTPKCSATIEFVAGKLRECVRAARNGPNGAAHVFVGTLTPPGPFVPTPGYRDRRIAPAAITQLNARIRLQIPAEGAAVVDIYPLFLGHEAEYTSPDGLHLFPRGNQAVAEAFFSAIKTTITQTPAFGLTR